MGLRKIFSKSVGIRIGKYRLRLGSLMVILLLGLSALFVFALIPGGPGGSSQQGRRGQAARRVTPVVAQAGGYKIERQDFEMRFMRMVERQSGGIPISRQAFAKHQLMESMIEHHLLLKAVNAEKLKVSRQALNARIEEMVEDSIQRNFPDQKQLVKYLQKKGLSYDQYRNQLREALAANRDAMREDLLLEKLEEKVKGQVEVTDETVKQQYEEVKARHILIRPDKLAQGATDEADQAEGPDADSSAPELSEEQAEEQAWHQAEELLVKIEAGADFAQLAQEHSDDTASAAKGGDLGWFSRRAMVKQFSDAAFALEPGQVSGVVKSPFGVHIIKVEDKRVNLPEDFEENKQRYLDQQKAVQAFQAWNQYKQDLKQQADIQIHDPELQALGLITQGRQDEAIPLLMQAAENDPYNLTARYALAETYQQKGNKQQAVERYRQVVELAPGPASSEVHLELGKLLRDQAKKEEALQEFKSASDWAAALQYGNNRIHAELKSIYQQMGHTEGVAQEQAWLDEFDEAQTESMGGAMTLN